ncbi:hypothetical protein [Sphingomonas adhaesiva]
MNGAEARIVAPPDLLPELLDLTIAQQVAAECHDVRIHLFRNRASR